MKEIQGDLIKLALAGEFDVITHGNNCFCNMGAGIAKTIKQHFPEVYSMDIRTDKGDKKKLGTCNGYTYTLNNKKLSVLNSYTQYHYGKKKGGIPPVDYDAIRSCMKFINSSCPNQSIGIPLIGCGLAGGKWSIVKKIIEEELTDMDVTIVHYKG